MKVLHLINSLATGGAEKLIVETLPLLREKGIEADVLLLNGTEYPLYKELEEKHCCRIYSLGTTSVYNPLLIFKIIPYVKKYDLVHVHLFPAQYFAVGAKWLSFSKIPFVFTEHSTSNRRFNSKKFKWVDRIIYNSYNRIICITSKVSDAVRRQTNIKEDQLAIIENGINLEKIKNAHPYLHSELDLHLSETDQLIMQVSSFQEPKDQPTLIRALQHLPDRVKLLLVGDGVLRKDCEQLVQDLHLQHRVFFLGLRSDVPSLLKSCDVIVLSSKYEGLSLSSIEGMASGKPFVTSDVPGLSEVVGGAGVLFPQGDDRQLAKEIEKLLNDQSYYEAVAEKGIRRSEKYDIHLMVDRLVQLYKSFHH